MQNENINENTQIELHNNEEQMMMMKQAVPIRWRGAIQDLRKLECGTGVRVGMVGREPMCAQHDDMAVFQDNTGWERTQMWGRARQWGDDCRPWWGRPSSCGLIIGGGLAKHLIA